MRIFDQTNDKTLKTILLFLTKNEMKQMIGYLEQMENDTIGIGHAHLDDEEYQHEITIALYDEKNMQNNEFNERCKKVIVEDK